MSNFCIYKIFRLSQRRTFQYIFETGCFSNSDSSNISSGLQFSQVSPPMCDISLTETEVYKEAQALIEMKTVCKQDIIGII